MSVLIKGMDELPEDGQMLVVKHVDGKAYIKRDDVMGFSMEIVQLPDHHGRLVDADPLIEFIEDRYDITWKDDYEGGIKDACTDILEKIDTMPTIVEAEDTEC